MKQKRKLIALLGLGCMFFIAIGEYYAENRVDGNRISTVACASVNRDAEKEAVGVEVKVDHYYVGQGVENRKASGTTPITTEAPKEKIYYNEYRNLEITEKEYEVLLRIVEAEATGGSMESKRMVANVVLNRVTDDKFPDTIEEVVFQRGTDGTAQFSPISDGRYNKVTITKETKKAVREVVNGKDETNGALFFLNRDTASSASLYWFDSSLKYLFECGGHSYYCYKTP